MTPRETLHQTHTANNVETLGNFHGLRAGRGSPWCICIQFSPSYLHVFLAPDPPLFSAHLLRLRNTVSLGASSLLMVTERMYNIPLVAFTW